jgi:nitroimidazol reductase NimA-like FMN-containing flavoprotein (pyridoxamine 5'-phosphate oxidase superfamily)
MPGYGLAAASEGAGLLSWSWAEERLARSHNYWVATVWPDGRPQLTAVWGAWFEGRFVFSCGHESRKARNLAANPEVVVSTESADEAVIVEGQAARDVAEDALARFLDAYEAKYSWRLDPGHDRIFAVAPRVVFGFIEHDSQFAQTATRWTFGG